MKKMLYLAAALLAAAACAREQVIPEEPETGNVMLTDVTLVAGTPETRTELKISPQVPLWSAHDAIDVICIDDPEFDEETNTVIVHPFASGLNEASQTARFHNGEEDPIRLGRTYWAAYPREVYDEEDHEWKGAHLDGGYTDDRFYPYVEFLIPQLQYPTPTSFDKNADLLISEPFQIVDEDEEGSGTATVDITFTRVNAIVKVVLQDKTADGILNGKKVKKVVLDYLFEYGGDGRSYSPAATRVLMEDGEGYDTGLSGYVRVDLGIGGEENEYICDTWGNSGVAACYTEDTEYAIGESGAATYLIVNPCVLKNGEDYHGVEGLRIQVETEDLLIERYVDLPEEGLALQPSRMTTLNIGLYDQGVRKTDYQTKGLYVIQYDEEQDAYHPVSEISVRENEFAEVTLAVVGFTINDLDEEMEWTCAPVGAARVDFSQSEYVGFGDFDWVRIWGEQASSEPATITFSAGGYSVSLTVNVGEASPIIQFADENTKSACVFAWDDNGDGEVSMAEAASATSLYRYYDKDNYRYDSEQYQYLDQMQYFDELQYFTGLQSIGENAFRNCTNLKHVTLPPQVTSIGKNAFYYCFQTVPEGQEAISLTLPSLVTSIGENAFAGCSKLASFTVVGEIAEIGNYAFADSGLTQPDNLLAHAASVGMFAFQNCPFTAVTLPENTTFGQAVFMHTGLMSVELPASMTEIPAQFLYDCESLKTVSFRASSSLTKIGNEAFSLCYALDDISLPNTLTEIGVNAFHKCKKLASIALPASLRTIGAYAFEGCEILENVSLPSGLTGLGAYAFSGTKIGSVTIPVGVTSIGDYAFKNCISLSNVGLPSALESLGEGVFSGCRTLASISLPASLTAIGKDCFSNCISLDGVSLPEGLTGSLPDGIFGYCASLQRIDIPRNITGIGSGAFRGCGALSAVSIQGSLTFVGSNAFQGCYSLTTLDIPGALNSIGESAFLGCTQLGSITFDFDAHADYPFIGKKAFQNCSSLESITLPDCLTGINGNTFAGCTSLRSIHLPDNLSYIDEYAFTSCTALHSIVFPAGLSDVFKYAFQGVTFRSGNGENGIKFLGTTPPTMRTGAVLNGQHWDGSDWASGVEIRVPSGSEGAYSVIDNILNTNNIIVGFNL